MSSLNRSRDTFSFPYNAYVTQQRLMEALYGCIENSQVGFFESPTGTGKSLSAICAVGTWISREEERILADLEGRTNSGGDKKASSGGGDWLADILAKGNVSEDKGAQRKALDKYKDMKRRVVDSVEKQRIRAAKYRPAFGGDGGELGKGATLRDGGEMRIAGSQEKEKEKEKEVIDDDDEFVLVHYDSDDEKKRRDEGILDDDSDDDDKEDDDDDAGMAGLALPQLLYCSRTHSQVSQFVNEFKKTEFKDFRCVTLGSRRNLCINSQLQNIKSDTVMSERCLEMAKSKSSRMSNISGSSTSSSRETSKRSRTMGRRSEPCDYHKAGAESSFGYTALNRVRDIEELAALGRQLGTCPYYGTRRAVRRAHVVCMPYSVMMSEEARAAMGVRLEGNIIVIDEAHNIVDAVNNVHSADVSLKEVEESVSALEGYIARFKSLLGGKNLYYLNVLHRLLTGIKEHARAISHKVGNTRGDGGHSNESFKVGQDGVALMATNHFVFGAKLDDINIFKVKRHVAATHLERRIGGYADALERRRAVAALQPGGSLEGTFSSNTNALRSALRFALCLTNDDEDGRVVIVPGKVSTGANATRELRVKFHLLNPANHFEKVVKKARSVMLLGGTMQPFSLLTASLVPRLSADKFTTFVCDHVVPRENVLALAMGHGPNGGALDFRHGSKSESSTLLELYGAMHTICLRVPQGKVVFFTSYAYLETVLNHWRRLGLLAKLEEVQPVFTEPRGASEVERIWSTYSKMVAPPAGGPPAIGTMKRGALLLCVMGGKMSEGINFSDGLARAVVCVGMPFADARDPLLSEQLRHADEHQPGSSKILYEGMCMRSVNQSVGRSIRHVSDFASILLLDARYTQERVRNQLPGWIQNSLKVPNSFHVGMEELTHFFRNKASNGSA